MATLAGLLAVPFSQQAGAVTLASPLHNLATGMYHGCALDPSNQARCWGYNVNGEVGDGTTTPRASSVPVSGGHTFQSLQAGENFSCGLDLSGAAWCWGQNNFGQLGTGDNTQYAVPTAVTGGHTFVAMTLRGHYHACALTSGGDAWCWGRNTWGALGNGTNSDTNTPTIVSGSHNFKYIDGGGATSCGIDSLNAAWCWGANYEGEVGNGTNSDSNTPQAVVGGHSFIQVSEGDNHACALDTDGAAWCWGFGSDGTLGENNSVNRNFPVAVQGGHTFRSMESGSWDNCALTLDDGSAWCWGTNWSGSLGIGGGGHQRVPVAVLGGLHFTSIAKFHTGACGFVTSGAMYCWGYNGHNEFGDGTSNDSPSPTVSWFMNDMKNGTVNAVVDSTLTFVVASHAGACNGVAQTAGTSASATAAALGHVNATANAVVAQDLKVTTNAAGGFTVFGRDTGAMTDGSHPIADIGNTNASPGAFASAGTADFGYSVDDATLSGTANRFTNGGAKWAAMTTSNAELSYEANGPVTNNTTCIAYQLGVATNTPAGTYATTVIYTAIPIL